MTGQAMAVKVINLLPQSRKIGLMAEVTIMTVLHQYCAQEGGNENLAFFSISLKGLQDCKHNIECHQ